MPFLDYVWERFPLKYVWCYSGYTLVQVREKLSELQKAGKRAKVQELIAGFGVKKLTEVPEDRYTELMQKAGEL